MTAPFAYPDTRREDIAEEHFGVTVADPYRWLENDVRSDPAVRDWVTAENAATDAYLKTLPARAPFRKRIQTLFDFERFGVPMKKGGRYFYAHNSGLQNQAVLYVRDALDGEGRVLIDPNGWSDDGAAALGEWVPSEDGAALLYTVQDGGTDWRTVKVLDVATGEVFADEVHWVKFSNFAWAKNGAGFFYSRFPEPESAAYHQPNHNHAVYFHKLGSEQSTDRLVFAAPDRPRLNNFAEITDDGNWLLISSSEGTDDRFELTVIDLTNPRMTKRVIVRGLENHWSLVGNRGASFYFVTDQGAPRRRIVSMDIASMARQLTEVVPQDAAVLEGAATIGGVLFARYMVDVKNEVRRYSLEGVRSDDVVLPGIGAVSGFGGEPDDPETFYAFTSFATPTTIYRYDVASGERHVWAAPTVSFDPDLYAVEQVFFTSKDGTQVPMFVVGRRDLPADQPAPTLLYGYGGFNIPVPPAFAASRIAWMEQGGVFAVANIRGGGEYGKEWHEGGRLANKQNSFDDFIAAAEYLIAQGVTTPEKLAIQGGSNGGLLVGAVVNQRPDLFAAATPIVGVMDMLRFDRFTAGRYWVDDYGSPGEEVSFQNLHAYSPYHNIKSGADYPAILVTTADTDDRVVPGHSFKYAAALQHAEIGDKPHLIRIETRAGHGSGKPTDKVIEEAADLWAFAAAWTGMTVKPVK